MRWRSLKWPLLLIILLIPVLVSGQEDEYDDLLQRVDTVENPVYKPVVSFNYGILNFRGDVNNSYLSPITGNSAFRINISTFIDKQHHFTANFGFMYGILNGNQYSYTDLEQNLNFLTHIYSIGVSLEYRFGHLFDKNALVRPYVSLGIENMNFSAKGDLFDENGLQYFYWTDGTIRDIEESTPGTPVELTRDFEYETDLRSRERLEFNLGEYGQRSMAIPGEIGLLFRINDRAFLNMGVSYHFTFTDFIDNVAFEGTSIQGSKGNDSYVFSSIGLHFDLFSDPTTRTVDLLYADVEFDPIFFDDEDGDFVLDIADHCPGTPFGIAVDTLGCPFDNDGDGVPDYLDQEPETRPGAWVDDEGVTVTEDVFYASIESHDEGMDREDVERYMNMIKGHYTLQSAAEIPEKFISLDKDGDGYISFEELLMTIDDYFDFQLDLSIDEVRELNEFFFSQ